MNSWVRLKKITPEQFYVWSEESRKIREKAKEENWDVERFVKTINDLEV